MILYNPVLSDEQDLLVAGLNCNAMPSELVIVYRECAC